MQMKSLKMSGWTERVLGRDEMQGERKSMKESGINFKLPSEEEIAELVMEAARVYMQKYPALSLRLFDAGDLVGEFYLTKKKYVLFKTEEDVQYLRHKIFVYMGFVAKNMLCEERYKPVCWQNVELDREGFSGCSLHETIDLSKGMPNTEEKVVSEEVIEEFFESIPGDMMYSPTKVSFSLRDVAYLCWKGYKDREIAKALGYSSKVRIHEFRRDIKKALKGKRTFAAFNR